jgi:hypothetical protein
LKGIKRGLRGYGVKVWLKPKAEPNAYGDAGTYSNEVDEDFKQSENDEGANAHGVRFVERGPTTLLTRFAEELRRAPAAGGF